jgi:hypothetical protein
MKRWYNIYLLRKRMLKMMPKVKSILVRPLLLSLFTISLLTSATMAQSPAPLELLNIALWPEYDRPEVLVIYRGQVAEDVPLPAQVSFNLPEDVEALNAVAYLDEAQGRLLNLPEHELIDSADGKVLSFATPSREFQFEYYSDGILSRDGDAREVSFSFTPTAEVAALSFELQQPTGTSHFTSEPPASDTEARQDGLTYAFYDLGAASTGASRSLQASYTRDTDQLSAESLVTVNVPSSAEQATVEAGGGGLQDYLGPILIVVGVLFLTGSLIYWFWSQRSVVVPEPTPRPSPARTRRPSTKKKPSTTKSPPPAKDEKLGAYCHRCGTKFRDDALFCHACGSERRAE